MEVILGFGCVFRCFSDKVWDLIVVFVLFKCLIMNLVDIYV